jgi:hypothetical protein
MSIAKNQGESPMRRGLQNRRGVVALSIMMGLLCVSGLWGNGAMIRPDDWQYQELDALAQAGLLSGHPRGPIADWTDRLTRYEAASMTLRAVEGVGGACRQQGEMLQRIAQGEAEPEEAEPPPGAVTGEDLARVEKLIQEFRTELVTMGVRVDDLETALEDIDRRVSRLEAERRKLSIDGYLQLRYEDNRAPGQNPEFSVRRARFNIRGSVTEEVSYRLEFQADAALPGAGKGSTTQLRSAYADYERGRTRVRIGQAKVPWGCELGFSSEDLWTSERALFMDALFPDQRDIGIQARYQASDACGCPRIDVGIFNGTGINSEDNNDRKTTMIRANWPFGSGEVALSAYTGTDGDGRSATRQDRYGIGARYDLPHGMQLVSEFARGREQGADVRGWYAQLGRPLRGDVPNLVFLKYDAYDEDMDMPDDMFKRWSLGYWWDPKPPIKVRFVYEIRRAERGFSQFRQWENDRFFTELQLVY